MTRPSFLTVLCLAAGVAFVACNGTDTNADVDATPAAAPATGAVTLDTDEHKALYAIGVSLARQLGRFSLTADDLAPVQAGLRDAVLGNELQANPDDMRTQVQELMKTRQAAAATQEKERAKAYLEKAAAEDGAVATESGLIYRELTAGTGDAPTEESRVKVHYRGTLTDGTEFDSSYKRNTPATFPLRGVIKCWTEALQKMKVGGKAKISCPSDIAYGDAGRPPTIPPGATLVFEVELLEIVK